MSMSCSRCGTQAHCEYGSDGLPYCGSCIFHGLNKPCFRCRMYVPASELQQYKGQWMCPYCLMDSRDEDNAAFKHTQNYAKATYHSEQCERCGRQPQTIYNYRGMRMCKTCVDEGKKEWDDVGADKPTVTPYRVTTGGGKKGLLTKFLEAILGNALARLGVKLQKGKSTIVSAEKSKMTEKKEEKKRPPPAILNVARPIREKSLSGEKSEVVTQKQQDTTKTEDSGAVEKSEEKKPFSEMEIKEHKPVLAQMKEEDMEFEEDESEVIPVEETETQQESETKPTFLAEQEGLVEPLKENNNSAKKAKKKSIKKKKKRKTKPAKKRKKK